MLRVHTCVHILNRASFEWDEKRRRTNLQNHGVEFADAAAALEDENAITIRDEDADEEERFITIGSDAMHRVLVVVYTWRGDNIRLISARRATRRERGEYEG